MGCTHQAEDGYPPSHLIKNKKKVTRMKKVASEISVQKYPDLEYNMWLVSFEIWELAITNCMRRSRDFLFKIHSTNLRIIRGGETFVLFLFIAYSNSVPIWPPKLSNLPSCSLAALPWKCNRVSIVRQWTRSFFSQYKTWPNHQSLLSDYNFYCS